MKNGRIETVNGDEISRPNYRIDEGLKQLETLFIKINSYELNSYCKSEISTILY